MTVQVVTGNHAAGYALSAAGEANRTARGAACGIYPITPQTEIVEFVARFPFSKGRVVPVESEHSAMAVSIGASLGGARAFTASTTNGLAYMTDNVMVAGYYRLPIVMVAVNRTLGPPWNIWADQGDTLMLRDFAWLQFYCETNQEVLDTTLLAFRLAEDHRILLPVLTCMDAFIVSHTQTETTLPEQKLVDSYLPDLDLPHRLHHDQARTIGGMVWPHEDLSQRLDIDEAMKRVPGVYQECRQSFREVFGRDPGEGSPVQRVVIPSSLSLALGLLPGITPHIRSGGFVHGRELPASGPGRHPGTVIHAGNDDASRDYVVATQVLPGRGGVPGAN